MLPGDYNLLLRLRCPNGCDVRFLQHLYWEDEGPESVPAPVWMEQEMDGGLFMLGLRCGDCGFRYGVPGIELHVREALKRLQSDFKDAVKDFIAELEDARERQRERARRTLEEGLL